MQVFYENKSEKVYCRNIKGHILQCGQHLHYNVEIAFIHSGLTYVYVDNNTAKTASGGDVVLVFPNQIHSFSTKVPEEHILLVIDPKKFPEYARLFSDFLPTDNIIKGAAKDKELLALIDNISSIYDKKDLPYREQAMRGYILAFLSRLFALMEFKKTNAEDMNAIGHVINYCINNYEKNLSLDLLEKELHINKYYISHIINKKLGMNFNDYINSIRVSNACIHLVQSNMSISEKSEAVGFNTVRTFNRAFTKQTGLSPRNYKNRNLEKAKIKSTV